MSEQVGVAVLGAGLIGLDLIGKIQRSMILNLHLVVGRDHRSLGLRRAAELGCATAAGGARALVESGLPVQVVFDASDADCHAGHWSCLQPTGMTLIDLTPAQLGTMVVPTVNGAQALAHRHVGLISCGGQAAIPLLHAIAQRFTIDYVEVVCTAASASAGRATRRNLDHYLKTTEAALRAFTGAAEVKVLANLSPATPAPPFRVVITALVRGADPDPIRAAVQAAAWPVRLFAPGFAVPFVTVTEGRVGIGVEVTAEGGRIPRYAGNLDLINAAAAAGRTACSVPAPRGRHGMPALMTGPGDRWIQEEAERLILAERHRRPMELLSRRRPGLTLTEAYCVQWRWAALRVDDGARVVGHKVGLTSEAMRRQIGIDEPDSGILLDSMAVPNTGVLRTHELVSPRFEAEIAVRLRDELRGEGVDEDDARAAVAEVFLALEVIDTRYALEGITLADSVADNAGCARFVLGDPIVACQPDGTTGLP